MTGFEGFLGDVNFDPRFTLWCLELGTVGPKGPFKNKLYVLASHLHTIFGRSSIANPQRRSGYAYGFAQSLATKSGAKLSANSAKFILERTLRSQRDS